jgi:hypothetical protein
MRVDRGGRGRIGVSFAHEYGHESMSTYWMDYAATSSTNILARKRQSSHRGAPRGRIIIACTAVLIVAVVGLAIGFWPKSENTPMVAAPAWPIPAEYDADRAYEYLRQVAAIGPRPSGSPGMIRQQQMLEEYFQAAGAEVEMQAFPIRHPETGEQIEMVNVIARFRPEVEKRYLICAHYDTRPYPDRDPVNPRGVFVGANDGASGVAALMEMAHHIPQLPANVGVDLVLFDGEELVYDPQRDPYFLGSEYFAKQYVMQQASAERRPGYVAGVLLDMIGDRELQLYYERNSWNYARDITVEIWSTAKRLRIPAFQPRIRHLVRDDHLNLNQIAKIPTTDLIDFDYPRPGFRQQSYWHTTEDTVDKCSGQSIVAVVYVLHTWLANKG